MMKKTEKELMKMNEEEIINKLRTVKTKPELDSLRLPLVTNFMNNKEQFDRCQKEFIKAKNRLRRIPLKDRTW